MIDISVSLSLSRLCIKRFVESTFIEMRFTKIHRETGNKGFSLDLRPTMEKRSRSSAFVQRDGVVQVYVHPMW